MDLIIDIKEGDGGRDSVVEMDFSVHVTGVKSINPASCGLIGNILESWHGKSEIFGLRPSWAMNVSLSKSCLQ